MILLLLSQLAGYGSWWLAFIAIAYLMARYLGWGGAILGQIIIFLLVSWLDWLWIQEEMFRPGWNGLPDMDVAFEAGVIIRVVLVNTLLLIVNVIAIRLRRRAANASKSTIAHATGERMTAAR
jgi:hypothetical protein